MSRYKVFRAHEHSKHSNRFEVWDTELQQCKGQYVGRESAQKEADTLNGTRKPIEGTAPTGNLQLCDGEWRPL